MERTIAKGGIGYLCLFEGVHRVDRCAPRFIGGAVCKRMIGRHRSKQNPDFVNLDKPPHWKMKYC